MLDLDSLDVGAVVEALEDGSEEKSWFLDPRTGEVHVTSVYFDNDDDFDPEEMVPIEQGFGWPNGSSGERCCCVAGCKGVMTLHATAT